MTSDSPTPAIPAPLFLYSLLYGGMTCIAGVLGSKQVALGPLAVEAGIFPFLMLVALSSTVAELYGKPIANRLVRFGFVPLLTAIGLTWIVLALPTDEGMYEPAKEAFPIVLSQSWRLMAAGILAYGVSMTLNVYLFSRLARAGLPFVALRGAIASIISQVVDTIIFITVAFYGVRPIAELLLGQSLAKIVLSILLVPLLIKGFVMLAKRMAPAPEVTSLS
ncbi:queuosine precursor transporter [Alteraurantiacibacter aquimixticola]|uniref:Probable queuosine precursor transporter n=1 Tax=Alteraurantiacibacter aquimixticola TaxID=2489173 RepID=A0A4T3F3R6_9SPHN|nr:queuosine precursor transporter [Alteraurantiacibacter aquimixticola]TIX51401.1 VUT family protein [Alteraurantiacibacter aquimixticola]